MASPFFHPDPVSCAVRIFSFRTTAGKIRQRDQYLKRSGDWCCCCARYCFMVIDSLLFARLIKWLPHFKARGESSNVSACIACIVLLSLELILGGILLLSAIVFHAIGICILVFFACFRKTGWTWKEFNDIFKRHSKIDIEDCFQEFIEWYIKHKLIETSVPREENSPITAERDSSRV
ncbi:hypothetical protein GGI35DRAFT_454782 [Trichoderma velutinum]